MLGKTMPRSAKSVSLLGVDVGTTGTKAMAFGRDGVAQGRVRVEHPASSYPGGGAVEQDAEVWWDASRSCLRNLAKTVGMEGVTAVGLTGLALTTVLLDSRREPMRRGMLYSDTRYHEFREKVNGIAAEPGYGTVKHFGDVMWAMSHEGMAPDSVATITDAIGYVGFKLTGNASFDRFLMPEAEVKKLCTEIGLRDGCFGIPHGYTDIIGNVTAEASKATGLPAGIPVVVGPWDGMCNIVGSGLMEEGIGADVAGSTEILAVATSKRPQVMTLPHIVGGMNFTYSSPPLGTMHRWFVSNFYGMEGGVPAYDAMEREARTAPPGSGGLMFVPCDPSGKGGVDPIASFVGMSPRHEKSHLARAVLEGIAFGVRRVLDAVEVAGVEIREMRVSGGGSVSDFWTQIKADVTRRKMVRLRELETGCLGSAMLAGVGTGVYRDIVEATVETVKVAKEFVPDEKKSEMYSKMYEEFVRHLTGLCA